VPGGSPFNVARNLAALGAVPLFITRIGSDADAGILLDEFARWQMPLDGVQRDPRGRTGHVAVTLDEHGHRFVIGDDQAWDAIDAAAALALVERRPPSIVCFNTLAQRSPVSRAAIAAVLETSRALRVLDLNLREGADNDAIAQWSLAHADIVKVNEDELQWLLERFTVHGNGPPQWGSGVPGAAIAALLQRFPLKRLLVTRGAEGYAVFDGAARLIAQGGTPAVQVVDTVGAGDAFLAVALLGEARAWPLATTLARAAEFAAGICMHRGAVAGTADFYRAWRRKWRLPGPSSNSANSQRSQPPT
jgi:fructokinase